MNTAAFSGDGKRIVTASNDRTVHIWDSQTGKEIAVLRYSGTVLDAGESGGDGGRRVRVVTSNDDTAHIWDVESGKEIANLKHAVTVATLSGDGKRVVTASRDNTTHIWDAQNGKEIAVLKGHDMPVTTAVFSGDGDRVLTASRDDTARIWDAESGGEIVVLKGFFPSPVTSAAFNRDGTWVVTGSYLMAHIWDISWAALARGDVLRERVCAERLVGAAQELTDSDMDYPICAASIRAIWSRVIHVYAAAPCRSTTGHVFQANSGAR